MNEKPSPTYRSAAEVRRQGNRLQDESSLYLQQHAHNPVDWYPWGPEALARSRAEDKPIFLSIGYSSCHWCHVMEQEVFDHDDVAEFLNRNYICIKVDREERPDLDAVYMAAVQTITGRGGWPLSVFLTPDQKPFFGGTYFPHDAFLDLLRKILDVYRQQLDELTAQADRLAAHVTSLPQLVGMAEAGPDSGVTPEILEKAALQAEANFDRKWGGFLGQQKFPTPAKWRFLLHRTRLTGQPRPANLVRLTLEFIASGGIHDQIGGGFHRYAVDPKWLVPHFEKMLYDNAQLASLFLEAGVVLDREDFRRVGLDALDFLIDQMSDPGGGFYSSFDADSDGREGSFYAWTPDDLTIATSAADGPVLADLLGVGLPGNFERDSSVLTRRADVAEVAAEHERDPEEVEGLFTKHRQNLRAYRSRRTPPVLDRKIITSWNGLTLSALAAGYAVSGEARYLQAAQKAAAFLWRVHRHEAEGLYRASNGGRPAGEGILDDYVFLAQGLLDLYQVTGEVDFLTRALGLVDHVRREFRHPENGYYLTSATTEVPLGRKVDLFDSVIPSGNAVMLQALVRAAALTGNQEYRREAAQTLAAYGSLIQKAGLEMAGWLDAAQLLAGPLYEVIVAGEEDAGASELIQPVLRTWPANAVLARVPADGPDPELARLLKPALGKKALDGRATAYVCQFGTCQAPTSDPAVLLAQLAPKRED